MSMVWIKLLVRGMLSFFAFPSISLQPNRPAGHLVWIKTQFGMCGIVGKAKKSLVLVVGCLSRTLYINRTLSCLCFNYSIFIYVSLCFKFLLFNVRNQVNTGSRTPANSTCCSRGTSYNTSMISKLSAVSEFVFVYYFFNFNDLEGF